MVNSSLTRTQASLWIKLNFHLGSESKVDCGSPFTSGRALLAGRRPQRRVGRRNVRRVKQLTDVRRWHRPAKQVSLSFVDTVVADEQFELFLSLDTLDHNVKPQLRTQPGHPAQ
jgi:hypothetical protein